MEEQSSVSLFNKIFIYTVAIFVDFAQILVASALGIPSLIFTIIEKIPASAAGLAGILIYAFQKVLGVAVEALEYAHAVLFYLLQITGAFLLFFAFYLIFRKMQIRLAKYEKVAASFLYKKTIKSVIRRMFTTQVLELLPLLGFFPINTLGVYLSLKVIQRVEKKEINKLEKEMLGTNS